MGDDQLAGSEEEDRAVPGGGGGVVAGCGATAPGPGQPPARPQGPPVAVGIIGAGRWAADTYAPTFAAGPETALTAVYARRIEAATALAGRFECRAFDDLEPFFDAVDAVVVCVAPEAQPEFAARSARAGKAVLVDKPLALDHAGAARLASEVARAEVGSIFALTLRFSQAARDFLDRAAQFPTIGARGAMITGSLLAGPDAQTPWRRQHGSIYNSGAHILDMMDAAVGPIVEMKAMANGNTWIGLLLQHASGALSEVTISCRVALPRSVCPVQLYSELGVLEFDAVAGLGEETFATLRQEFAAVARGGRHPVDAARGLYVQGLLACASEALRNQGTSTQVTNP